MNTEQFLTAVLVLAPTRRKATIIEKARAVQEEFFWYMLDFMQPDAMSLVGLPRAEKKSAAAKLMATAEAHTRARSEKISEMLRAGAVRDADQQLLSFIGLKELDDKTTWPNRAEAIILPAFEEVLDRLTNAQTDEEYNAARDDLARKQVHIPIRPLTLVRKRDCQIYRNDAGLVAALNITGPKDNERVSLILPGQEADTKKETKLQKTQTKILIPIQCSRWHENKFLFGKAELRSAKVLPAADGKWEMHAQFAFEPEQIPLSGCVIGIDRGCVYPVAASVVDESGVVLADPELLGEAIVASKKDQKKTLRTQMRRSSRRLIGNLSDTKSTRERRAKTQQGRRIDHELHILANHIVDLAVSHRARVIVEDLEGLKRVIVATREKGSRKGGWRDVLKAAQFHKLEMLLNYKLRMAGLPEFKPVAAGGSSQTCPKCGHRAKENRPTRDTFSCQNCGFENHSDKCASVIIARRGILIKPGVKLDIAHRDMVAGLFIRDDSGLGPWGDLSSRVVATHASVLGAYDSTRGSNPSNGTYSDYGAKTITQAVKNSSSEEYSQSVAASNWS